MPIFYRLVRFILKVLIRLLARLEVTGQENLPDRGPYVAVVNHLSIFEPPVVMTLLPHRATVLAAIEHRRDFFFGWLLDRVGAIWVRRGEADLPALRQALQVLHQGGVLGIAPEGTRSRTGALQEGKPGAALLAIKADAPIVPIAVMGTEQVLARLRRLRRPHVRVVIGPPFRLPAAKKRLPSRELRAYTDLIMARLALLLDPPYRGVYAQHPLVQGADRGEA
ncbi:MAG TPA: 1-acyl-sn-glycerol-3-phosphate acyltransferase [Chloroflexi bacterium]|nr:1-acyl-sn-glycerol-3-phosphate acyltransferase [Chloroflexota bacterium]